MPRIFLVFFGPPGSGKGTQAQKIAQRIKAPVISTGDLLRQETKTKTVVGREAIIYIKRGQLVPDVIVAKLISKRLSKADIKSGAVFDGYPRKRQQQRFFLDKIKTILKPNDRLYAVLVEVSDREALRRLGGRRACICGAIYHLKFKPPKKAGRCDLDGRKLFIRDDDRPEVIRDRLKTYHRQSQPLLDYWKKNNKLIELNGEQSIAGAYNELVKKLKAKKIKV